MGRLMTSSPLLPLGTLASGPNLERKKELHFLHSFICLYRKKNRKVFFCENVEKLILFLFLSGDDRTSQRTFIYAKGTFLYTLYDRLKFESSIDTFKEKYCTSKNMKSDIYRDLKWRPKKDQHLFHSISLYLLLTSTVPHCTFLLISKCS